MALSNFRIPTGLEVSGTSTITGSVGVDGTVSVTNLTASSNVSGNIGNFASLYKNGSVVLTSADLSGYALGSDVSASFVQPSQVSASFVQPAQLTGTVAFLTASNVFTTLQQITGGLSMTEDLSARTASLSGDLTVGGNLTVRGTATYVDSTTVNIGDKNINLGTGSSDLAVLSGGGIDLGTGAEVQWRYSNTANAWTSNVGLSSSVSVLAPVVTGSTVTGSLATFDTVSASVGLSGALGQFTQLTASSISASTGIASKLLIAERFASANALVGVATLGTGNVDLFLTSSYQSAKYIIKASSSTGDLHSIEALVVHNNSVVYNTSYASLYTSTPLIRIDSSIAGPIVTVKMYNDSANTVSASVMKFIL